MSGLKLVVPDSPSFAQAVHLLQLQVAAALAGKSLDLTPLAEATEPVRLAVGAMPLPALLIGSECFCQPRASVAALVGEYSFEAGVEEVLGQLLDCVDRAESPSVAVLAGVKSLISLSKLGQGQSALLAGALAAYAKVCPELIDGALRAWLAQFSLGEGVVVIPGLPAQNRKLLNCEEVKLDWASVKLPQLNGKNVLITSALPYVNNVPHLGNIIGAVLSGDVFASYCRLRGYQTIYICGTDEYGTATETKALEEGSSCEDLCSKYYKLHASIYDWFQCRFDIFGRSSTAHQTAITHDIFRKLYDNGYFFRDSVEQSYCEQCQRFLADRYVEGTCPNCGYHDARGDQCDKCTKLCNPTELLEPRCKLCRTRPVIRKSEHLFLDLTKLQPALETFVGEQSVAGDWSANSTSISQAWLHEGLKPRCMTRDLRWGTPVPVEGFEEKVFYVWFDACFGYISITANYTDGPYEADKPQEKQLWRQWWQNPQQVKLYQFMGKDNVPFHTVIFPGSLLGTDEPYTMLHHISTTEYLNYESGKFSKSRNIGVFGNDARDSGIPASVWRYYLLSVRPESADACFSWDDFQLKTNTELLANLGNLASRVLRFTTAKWEGVVPVGQEADEALDGRLVQAVNLELANYLQAMEAVHLKAGLKAAMTISALGNGFLTDAKLDNQLLISRPARCATVIRLSLNLLNLLASLLDPFMPAAMDDLRRQLNVPLQAITDSWNPVVILSGHQLGKPSHLFTRITDEQVADFRLRFSGTRSL